MATRESQVLPGFSLTLGYTVFYLSVLVLLPIARLLRQGRLAVVRRVLARGVDRARARRLPADVRRRRSPRRSSNLFLGPADRLGAGPLRVSRASASSTRSSTCRSRCRPRSAGWSTRACTWRTGWLGRYLVPLGIQGAYTPPRRSCWCWSSSACRSSCARCSRSWRTSIPKSEEAVVVARRDALADVPQRDPADARTRR